VGGSASEHPTPGSVRKKVLEREWLGDRLAERPLTDCECYGGRISVGEVRDAMIDALTSVLQVLLSSSSVIVASEAGAASIWAVVLAAAVVIVLLRVVGLPRSVQASLVRPDRAIDVSVAVAQSDPDAAGHPRSRAPGIAAPAA